MAFKNSFTKVAVSGQNTVKGDSHTDTLTLAAGSNVTITTDQDTDTITIASSGGGSGISSVVADTTPQLGGDLDVNGKALVSASNGDIELSPNGTGKVVFKGGGSGGNGAGRLVLNCENNSHGITLQGPPHSAGADYTLTLPNDDGSSGEVLSTNGSGVLSWASAGATTLNGLTDVSASSPSSGQVLKWNGSAWAPATDDTGSGGGGSGIASVAADTTPQLGGDLDVNGKDIVSASDGDITITPNGTGDIILDGQKWPQADGSNGQ